MKKHTEDEQKFTIDHELSSARNWIIAGVIIGAIIFLVSRSGTGDSSLRFGTGDRLDTGGESFIKWGERDIYRAIDDNSAKITREGSRLAFSVIRPSAVKAGATGTIAEVVKLKRGTYTISLVLDPIGPESQAATLVYDGLATLVVSLGERVQCQDVIGTLAPDSFLPVTVTVLYLTDNQAMPPPAYFEEVSRGERLWQTLAAQEYIQFFDYPRFEGVEPGLKGIGSRVTAKELLDGLNTAVVRGGPRLGDLLTEEEKVEIVRFLQTL